jgi:hypothetical protein
MLYIAVNCMTWVLEDCLILMITKERGGTMSKFALIVLLLTAIGEMCLVMPNYLT